MPAGLLVRMLKELRMSGYDAGAGVKNPLGAHRDAPAANTGIPGGTIGRLRKDW